MLLHSEIKGEKKAKMRLDQILNTYEGNLYWETARLIFQGIVGHMHDQNQIL